MVKTSVTRSTIGLGTTVRVGAQKFGIYFQYLIQKCLNFLFFKGGGLARLQIINTRFGYTCLGGTIISSVESNDGILVSKGGDPFGTRISTPFF